MTSSAFVLETCPGFNIDFPYLRLVSGPKSTTFEHPAAFAELYAAMATYSRGTGFAVRLDIAGGRPGRTLSCFMEADSGMEVIDRNPGSLSVIRWEVNPWEVIRTTLHPRESHRKQWQLYAGPGMPTTWEVTYNDHPRAPLHHRTAMVPFKGDQLRLELMAIVKEFNCPDAQVRTALTNTFSSWRPIPTLEMEQITVVHDSIRLLRTGGPIDQLLAQMDQVTWPGQRLLVDLFEQYYREAKQAARYNQLVAEHYPDA